MTKGRSMRRGQSGIMLENYFVYAIVLVTIIVGLVILWQMGVFKPPVGKKGYVGFSQVAPTDWLVSNDNEVYLRVKNEAEGNVRIRTYGINVTIGPVNCRPAPDNGDLDISVGESKTVRVLCNGNPSISTHYVIGGYFEADVAINYTNLLTRREHESTGRLYGIVEGYGVGGPLPSTTTTVTTTTVTTTTNPLNDCGNPCVVGMNQCLVGCRYCYTRWDRTYCEREGSCGIPCTPDTYDTYQDCQLTCPYCETGTSICKQGDCGKHCQFTGDPTCNLGCHWCNVTSQSCEPGDCGKPCSADNASIVCRLGCDKCQNGRCTYLPITVVITATNSSGGDEIEKGGIIHLNVTAKADRGVQRMIPSRGVRTSSEDCKPLATAVENSVPGGITNPWIQANQIPWFPESEAFDCNQATECRHTWTTSEYEDDTFCYYAIAQENQVFGGAWSRIAWDQMQIGYIKVLLVFPRPQ